MTAALFAAVPASAQPPMQTASIAVPSEPSSFQPAPMPNSGVRAPVGEADSTDPHLDPAFFQQQKTFWGNAFSGGDDASAQQDRRASAAVGAKVSVPMD